MNIDEIKIRRVVLEEYVLGSRYAYDHNNNNIYRIGQANWETVERNIRNLSKEYGIHVHLDIYPKTKLITITLQL